MMPMHCKFNGSTSYQDHQITYFLEWCQCIVIILWFYIQITHTLKWCQSIFSSMAQFMADYSDYSPTKWCLSSMTQCYSRIIITHILKWCQGIVSSLTQFPTNSDCSPSVSRPRHCQLNDPILLDYSPTKIMPRQLNGWISYYGSEYSLAKIL